MHLIYYNYTIQHVALMQVFNGFIIPAYLRNKTESRLASFSFLLLHCLAVSLEYLCDMTAVREEILLRWVLALRSLSMLALLSVHLGNRRSTLFVFNQIKIQYPFIKLHCAHIRLLYT